MKEKTMNLNKAIKLVAKLYKRQVETGERFSVELVSGPGIGKSESRLQIGALIKKVLKLEEFGDKAFFLSTVEQPDVRGFGLPATDTDGSRIMTYTAAPWMPKANEPKHGILFLDEFRQAGHDVQKPAAELLLNGRVGDNQLPITWMVVAASNREKDRSGVQRELAFLSNRRMEIKIEPSLDSWVDWAERRAIHWAAIAFAKRQPGVVFGDTVPDKPGPFCTPRSLVKMSHLIGQLDMEEFTEAAAGLIGEGAATQFVAFLRVVEQIPEFDEIVANPTKCKLPDAERPDAQYATMQMIAHRVDDATAEPAFNYMQRMGKEFQVAGLKATMRRCPAIVRSTKFADWVKANRDLLLSANMLDNTN
jgi:hypothetical protein